MKLSEAVQVLEERVRTADSGYVLEENGLKVLRELTVAEWRQLGRDIFRRYNGSRWAIGDWMVYGEGLVSHGARAVAPKGSSIYDFAVQITGCTQERLAEYARTSRAYPPNKRSIELPWSFYSEAKKLQNQERWMPALAKAKKEGWSITYFAQWVPLENQKLFPHGMIGRRKNVVRMKPKTHSHVKCPKCSHVFVIRGNRVKETS